MSSRHDADGAGVPGLERRIEDGLYPIGFEEDDRQRSSFMRELTLRMLDTPDPKQPSGGPGGAPIPRKLVRFWHDRDGLPDDVAACMASWDRLIDQGFEIRTFSDASAAEFIAERFTMRERRAFDRCRHPAMRSDYLRLCHVLAEGGMYVDADDVLLGDGWGELFRDDRLKLQPLCYDVPTAGMVPGAQIWRADLPVEGRIFYVNNDPIAAPAGHPVLRAALARATGILLGDDPRPEIQATTGPGNLTAALSAHARTIVAAGGPLDFDLIRNWEAIAETRWHLSYRDDERNWRNMAGA